MPKNKDLERILIIGAGPIIIGQACEFDYSGTQACKALKEEGYHIILANSNPATIMTDPQFADATYIEPLTQEVIKQIIQREKPSAILPTMGGQTALNLSIALHRSGYLDEVGVSLIGARAEAIEKAEDRLLFREAMTHIGLDCPRSYLVTSLAESQRALADISLPVIVRPSFTLGGIGGGIARDQESFHHIVSAGLAASPVGSALIEEALIGWKEFEMEVVRDIADNAIIVCSIENIDPMGIHTGDSATVAPALTLTDKEYQIMRDSALACLRAIGVDTGGANVQFAIDPCSGRQVIIEMNPRVSRSSALASKATGFPIARVAAKLAVGYHLDELRNDIIPTMPASFEPSLDYVAVKLPRFTFEKFRSTDPKLGSAMKSVGEVMAIGRCFTEALQKALRSLEMELDGLDEIKQPSGEAFTAETLLKALRDNVPERIRLIAQAFRLGISQETLFKHCYVDPWFLRQIADLVRQEEELRTQGLPNSHSGWTKLKSHGFSGARIAHLTAMSKEMVAHRQAQFDVHPVFKRIDSCAAEFPTHTPYMYSTYERLKSTSNFCEAEPSERNKAIILGSGPNRIGQGIEFDYCCVQAAFALADQGVESITVNCNPETVSTDFDTSDRLYFEPLTEEEAVAVARCESQNGCLLGAIVQFGGQTPLKLARPLAQAGVPILGTPVEAINRAEDRSHFLDLLNELGCKRPVSAIVHSCQEAQDLAESIGWPLVVRPSHVLGGRAMSIVYHVAELKTLMVEAFEVSGDNPVLMDRFLEGAIEVDVDAIADASGNVYVAAIMEHIEEAGIHSGDSACVLPSLSLSDSILACIIDQTRLLARSLGVIGLINIQFAVLEDSVFVLEANPRASRTVPFVAKATGLPIARLATRIILGETLDTLGLLDVQALPGRCVAVKEAVFPFARFPDVDSLLGPEMRSTGEVMGMASHFDHAFAKSQMAAGNVLPQTGSVALSVRDRDKPALILLARDLIMLGFKLLATPGTGAYLRAQGLHVEIVTKVHQGGYHIVACMEEDKVSMVINTTEGAKSIADSLSLRRAAITRGIPYYTTIAGARAAVAAISALMRETLAVASLQSYGYQKDVS